MTVSAGPQMVSCETCQRVFKSRRGDGKVARFCSWECLRGSWGTARSPSWRGSTNYWATHSRVRQARGAAKSYSCGHCGGQARDWALRHGLTGGDPDDFTPLCRRCHIAYDKPQFGRPHPGELNGSAKLTWDKVREIRALRGQVPVTKLAAMYGVSRQSIHQIMTGKSWAEQP